VKRPIDHLDADRGQEIIHKRSDRCDPEARPDQGDRLDHHVRMGHQVSSASVQKATADA
jgi:hypothetical protein